MNRRRFAKNVLTVGALSLTGINVLGKATMSNLKLNLLCNKNRMMREYDFRFSEGLGGGSFGLLALQCK